ncbi:hypothetical protein LXL04_003359 [Taraxacum kok-saghyz]
MPLYRRKPFPILERPDDLKPEELVFQVRFTKEIFRDYSEYLKRINLYRQRVWTCKSTGKSNLTYEEALVSEKQANEKVQQFPKELMELVLRDVQFSMLPLRELVSTIASKLQERLLEGTEIYGRKNNRIYPCKIVKVIEEEVEKTQYHVAWLDKDKKVTENAVVSGEDLIKKKLPFGRDVLRTFIRESTQRSVPWVLHDKLAIKYGISIDLPEELKIKLSPKRKLSIKDKDANNGENKRKKPNDEPEPEDMEPIKYPIDDLMVKPAADDPVFTPRPPPIREFNVPMECVGDLLMVWDFCSSYSKLLNLSPFSLDDFENAICHKESNILLIVESQSALLRLLIKDDGDYFIALQKKKRKSKISLVAWTDYLCDFLELVGNEELTTHIPTIRRGHYGLLSIPAKVNIFSELVAQVVATDIMREKLDEYIEERTALNSKRRGEAIEEAKKRREKKELEKSKEDDKSNTQNGDVAKNQQLTLKKHTSENSGKKQGKSTEKDVKKSKADKEETLTTFNVSNGKGSKKLMDVEKKETNDTTNIEQRKEYLERELEKRFVRTNPLGKDRDYNRYWFFRKDSRVFVESCDHKQWGYYTTKTELDSLMGSLNRKGERERALKLQLEKRYKKISGEMQKKSKESQRIQMEEEAVLRRSSRVPPRDNPARSFLNYVNKLKQD